MISQKLCTYTKEVAQWKGVVVTVELGRLVIFCALIQGIYSQGTMTSCEAEPVYTGESASIICSFGEDVSQTNRNFKIYFYGTGRTKEKKVLDCFWQNRREVSCDTVAAGYTFNYTVSDHLTLSIPEATEDFVGKYECQVEPADPTNIQDCDFTLRYGVKPVIITSSKILPATTGAYTTTEEVLATAESSNTAGIVVAVLFILALIVAAVIVYIYRKRVREIGTRLLQRVRNGPETQREYTGQDMLTASLPRQPPVTAGQTEPLMSADSSKLSQDSEAVLEQLDEHGAHEDVRLDIEDNKHNANSGRIVRETPEEATPDMFSELSEVHRTSPEVSPESSVRFQAEDKTTNVTRNNEHRAGKTPVAVTPPNEREVTTADFELLGNKFPEAEARLEWNKVGDTGDTQIGVKSTSSDQDREVDVDQVRSKCAEVEESSQPADDKADTDTADSTDDTVDAAPTQPSSDTPLLSSDAADSQETGVVDNGGESSQSEHDDSVSEETIRTFVSYWP